MPKYKKLLLATGGTGGHLYPAQAIAVDLMQQMPELEVLFAGSGLKTNRYFDQKKFKYRQISSMTIFQHNLINLIKAPFLLMKGLFEAVSLMRSFRPDLVIGFGSFHTLPILFAAKFMRIPIALFEANAYPGRVNRLFSKWAKWCAIYFPEASKHLKTRTYLTQMPFWRGMLKHSEDVTREQSLAYLGLKPNKQTLLVFGGSQGAASINQMVAEAILELRLHEGDIQIVHITGNRGAATDLQSIYSRLGIDATVKEFEKHMHLVWPGIDLAICRAGAGSIAEQINYEVPGILIPYPHASNDHQARNGHFMSDIVKGADLLKEKDATAAKLTEKLQALLQTESNQLSSMQKSIHDYKQVVTRSLLTDLIKDEMLHHG